jgi:hypothetical protein
MSDRIEWGTNEIARWCRQEMRADVDSNMHRRAAAILGVLECHEKLRHEVERQKKFIDICSAVHGHNVKLKAQRDELRDAIERLTSVMHGTFEEDQAVVESARLAIAKAKGKE